MNIETQVKGIADNQPFWKEQFAADDTSVKGDDVKGAFLALLQGLVGYTGVNLSNIQVTPEAKIAKEDLAEQNADKKSDFNAPAKSFDKEEVRNQPKNEARDAQKESNDSGESTSNQESKLQIESKAESQASQEKISSNYNLQNNESEVSSVSDVTNSQTQMQAVVEQIDEVVKQNVQVVADASVKEHKVDPKVAQVTQDLDVETVVSNHTKERSINHSMQDGQTSGNTKIAVEVKADEVAVSNQGLLKTKTKKQYDVGIDTNLDEAGSVEDLLSKYLQEKGFDQSKQFSIQQGKDDYKILDKSNSIKDNILAKIMFGADLAAAASSFGSKHIASEAKSGIDAVIGLVSKVQSEKTASEKTNGSAFIRKSALSQEFVDKVKEVLEKAALNKTNDSISVKIDPPHLGQIHVKITHKNGEIYAKLTPENREVEHVLKSKSNELAQVLHALGFSPQEVHIQIGRDYTPEVLAQDGTHNFGEGKASNENGGMFEQNRFAFAHAHGSSMDVSENFVEQKAPIVDNGWVA